MRLLIAEIRTGHARRGTTDLTIAANCYACEDRVRSYELVAGACL